MNVKIKLLNDKAVIPKYAKPGDAGLDLVATSKEWDEKNQVLIFGTGIALEIPRGHVGFLLSRSSIYKTGLQLSNAIGTLDSSYRGEIKAIFYPGNRPKENYEVGDRVCQLIILPYPHIDFQLVNELSETERGTGGHGSTGK